MPIDTSAQAELDRREHATVARRQGNALGAAAAISLIVYLFNSRAVAVWLEQRSYLGFVVRSFLTKPVWHALPFRHPVPLLTLFSTLLSAASVIAIGVVATRALRGHRASAAFGLAVALAAAGVPAMAIATLWWPDGHGHITAPALAIGHLVELAAVWWWASRSGPVIEKRAPRPPTPLQDAVRALAEAELAPWSRAGFMLLVPFGVVVLLAGLSGIQGYDSFADHLARPARWLAQGSLEDGVAREVVTFYPGNLELFVRWTLATGTDRFAFLASLLAVVGSLWVLYHIAREAGQGRAAARMVVVLAASLQVLAYQGIVVYSDSYTALCLLLATWLLLAWINDGAQDKRFTFAIGVAFGLAMGAKYSAGPPVVVLGVVWLWQACRDASQRGFEQSLIDVRWLMPQVGTLVLGTIPGMAFWYVRNLVLHGNPVYPLGVAGLPGIPLDELVRGAPGPHGALQELSYPWIEWGHVLGFETGLGAIVATTVILALLVAPFATRTRASERLLWVITLVAAFAWMRTGVIVPRYGLFAILLSFVCVGSMLTAFPSRLLRGVSMAAAVLTIGAVGFQLAGGAAYNMLFYDARPPVPAAIDTMPAARVLNLAGQPSGYYLMGADYRHRVLTPFAYVPPQDVAATNATLLLLPADQEAQYQAVLPLELVDRFTRANWPATSLWRVRAK